LISPPPLFPSTSRCHLQLSSISHLVDNLSPAHTSSLFPADVPSSSNLISRQ
jgi:hypothetical protein